MSRPQGCAIAILVSGLLWIGLGIALLACEVCS